MLPEQLQAWDASALLNARTDRGELTLDIAPEKIAAVCRYLKDQQRFARLSAVTAVDRYPAEPRFEVVYLLHSIERNQRLRLKCRLPGEAPEIDSVTAVWRAANWYEREVFDLFGVRFRNHPDLRRILLPEDWSGHPLRKDYPATGQKYNYTGEAL
ncbi:MAG: NADH-quinone oxidoreductase subunit C [Bryobacteraceae bacterium]|jgi:NADH-quinone oxidoreductase subunit C